MLARSGRFLRLAQRNAQRSWRRLLPSGHRHNDTTTTTGTGGLHHLVPSHALPPALIRVGSQSAEIIVVCRVQTALSHSFPIQSSLLSLPFSPPVSLRHELLEGCGVVLPAIRHAGYHSAATGPARRRISVCTLAQRFVAHPPPLCSVHRALLFLLCSSLCSPSSLPQAVKPSSAMKYSVREEVQFKQQLWKDGKAVTERGPHSTAQHRTAHPFAPSSSFPTRHQHRSTPPLLRFALTLTLSPLGATRSDDQDRPQRGAEDEHQRERHRPHGRQLSAAVRTAVAEVGEGRQWGPHR